MYMSNSRFEIDLCEAINNERVIGAVALGRQVITEFIHACISACRGFCSFFTMSSLTNHVLGMP